MAMRNRPRTATAIAFLADMETVDGGRTTEVINPWPV
jgi:hypothetical protein